MIKLVIFDLDGVLVNAKEIHYEALNKALDLVDSRYEISRAEHITTYDGLPTKAKLKMLTERKGLPEEYYEQIFRDKQDFTYIGFRALKEDPNLIHIFNVLKNVYGVKIAVASNSIRMTIETAIDALGVRPFVDIVYSNEDVVNPKPNPEMFLRCMVDASASPTSTLILEDSPHGRHAVDRSGAILCPVNNPSEVTVDLLTKYLHVRPRRVKWKDDRMNILIPMAGAGSRFAQAGYTFPKPLIEVKNLNSKPMIQAVVENINIDAHYVFIVQREHCEKYNLKQLLKLVAPGCDIVEINWMTRGAAETTLAAKEFIDNDAPLLIANSDQIVEWDSNDFIYTMQDGNDAGMLTFTAYGVKWSYAKVENGYVTEVAEKNPISDVGTVGIYWWSRGADYVRYAEQMIAKDIRTNNEFYVAPVFNEAIQDGKRVKPYHIDKMWGIGTPEDLEYFVKEYRQ